MIQNRRLFLAFLLVIILAQSCNRKSIVINQKICEKAEEELRDALRTQNGWVKVHAAEYLLALSYPEGVKETFTEELADHETVPQYRIGIWRTLARASFSTDERNQWVDRIWSAFLDENGPDRMHAAETLSKLRENLLARDPHIALRLLAAENKRLAAFVRWGIAVNSVDPHTVDQMVRALNSGDPDIRKITAYGIRFNVPLTAEQWRTLSLAAAAEPDSSSAAVYLVGAALARMPDDERSDESDVRLKGRLQTFLFSGTKENRYHACEAFAECGTTDDLPFLIRLLNGEKVLSGNSSSPEELEALNADVRIAAANAILRIYRRIPGNMAWIDWLVIAVYGSGMLAIGWYYSRRTVSSEDYNLGGRRMNPVMVGLSLFASIMSTLSYLAYPGEMIRNGPMYFTNLLVFPIVYLIVGWWFIPSIMRLKVTSANEILEIKLGKSVRLLGAFFFLSLRLLWMATIIYATVDNVMLPIFGMDRSYLPYICAAMGVVTLIYTSMGGIRAVVLTDVVQTVILIGGVIITIVTISVYFGGVTVWLPHSWPVHWPEARFGFDPATRVTMANAMLMVFMWYICTAGSDQMAIQRYLSTRNVKAARHSFGVSVATNLVVQILLGIVGLALLAYFMATPHSLPDGDSILSVSDRLFPQYIMLGLPAGLTGLLIAGIMAAAMSSLSSGVNSSATVISKDIIGRLFHKNSQSEQGQLQQVKLTSYGIGAVVVILSMFMGHVQGNLLDILIKVVNLFVGPLFLLFFMAMFIPWATSLGTFVGGLSCVAIAAAIAFYNIFGIGILWGLPASFAGGALVGMLMSWGLNEKLGG